MYTNERRYEQFTAVRARVVYRYVMLYNKC